MAERILIVDDDDFICELNRELLATSGYQIETAEDGLAAWSLVETQPDLFDLIILDKNMPGLDGLSLLKKIKANAVAKDVPVIFLTGDNQQQEIIEGLAAGAYYYLTKPSEEAVLKQVVRNALDERNHMRNMQSLIGQHTLGLQSLKRAEFTLRTIEEAKSLALILADATADPQRTVNGYSELLINAIEHGNLGITYQEKSQFLMDNSLQDEIAHRLTISPYAEREVTVLLANHGEVTTVIITDQGDGFDWRTYLEFDPERAFDLHGRGIAMSNSISFDDVRYAGSGNTVITTFFNER